MTTSEEMGLQKTESTLARATAEASHEESIVKAQTIMAMQHPRSEGDAFDKMMKSCQRPRFAEGSQYSFPRGGARVTGPSVKLARELARCWGNLWSGTRIIDRSVGKDGDEYITVQGVCLDLETNYRKTSEISFKNKVQRKRDGRTVWVEPDARDERENLNKHAALVERNTILQVLPPDIIEETIVACDKTLRKAAKGEVEQDKDSTIRKLVVAFKRVGVSSEMVAQHVGKDITLLTADDIVVLRAVHQSIADGNSSVDDHFKYQKIASSSVPRTVDDLVEKAETVDTETGELTLTPPKDDAAGWECHYDGCDFISGTERGLKLHISKSHK